MQDERGDTSDRLAGRMGAVFVPSHQSNALPMNERNTSGDQGMVEAVASLLEMLEPDREEGCVVFNHTPEEIGLHVMENYEDIAAALRAKGPGHEQ